MNKNLKNGNYPKILLNVCTHGTERVGLKVAESFKDFEPLRGVLVINVANKEALRAGKRFLDADLNRVFPGKKNGNREERLAYKLKPFVASFDVVLDVHSTETGLRSSVIVTNYNTRVHEVVKVIAPKRLIHMRATASNALISSSPVGLGLEFGKDKSRKTYYDTVRAVNSVLKYYGMTKFSQKTIKSKQKTEFFVAESAVLKPEGFEPILSIKNFSLVKKGTPIGHNKKTKEKYIAQKDFYPILFGRNRYKEIFGFSAKKYDTI